jgi:serine/threonine protein kinase
MSLLFSYSDSEPSVSEVDSRDRSSVPQNSLSGHPARKHHCKGEDFPDFTGKTIHILRQGPLVLYKKVGSGAYGVVYRATLKRYSDGPCREYAVKILMRSTAMKHGFRETSIHETVSGHPNIVKFYEMVIADPYVFIVMDYHEGGTLWDVLSRTCVFANNHMLVKSIFLQLIDAVEHCHSQSVFHRDLKPHNVICSPDWKKVYLADFGLATTEEETEGYAGTRLFQSPGNYDFFLLTYSITCPLFMSLRFNIF